MNSPIFIFEKFKKKAKRLTKHLRSLSAKAATAADAGPLGATKKKEKIEIETKNNKGLKFD